MEHLRRADAEVAEVTHLRQTARWRLNRYNPRRMWNAKKQRMMHPIEQEKMKARNKFNYMNPLFYIRRIKNNLKAVVQ